MYFFQSFALLSLLCFFFSVFQIQKRSTVGAICFFYMAMSGLVTMFYPELLHTQNPDSLFSIKSMAMTSFIYMTAIFSFIFMARKKTIDLVLTYLSLFAFADSFYLIGKWFFGINPYGMMLNTSMEGNFLAIMAPIIFFKKRNLGFMDKYPLLGLIPVVAIIITKSSNGMGGLCLGLLVAVMAMRTAPFKKTPLLVAPVVIAFVGYLYIGKAMFSDSLRFICWEWSFDWWYANASKYFGTGIGTFWGLGPWIQIKDLAEACNGATVEQCKRAEFLFQKNNYYTFMHNDWGQLLFEGGIVGLLIGAWAFIKSVLGSIGKPWLLSSIAVFAATSFINMPSRYVLTAVTGACLLRIATEKFNNDSEEL